MICYECIFLKIKKIVNDVYELYLIFFSFEDFFLFCYDEIIGIKNKYIKFILLILY